MAYVGMGTRLTNSDADKFNYLRSFLEGTAAEAVAGLATISANYGKAVNTLKRRFGNTKTDTKDALPSLLPA